MFIPKIIRIALKVFENGPITFKYKLRKNIIGKNSLSLAFK